MEVEGTNTWIATASRPLKEYKELKSGQSIKLMAGFDIESDQKLFDSKFNIFTIEIPQPGKPFEEVPEEMIIDL